MLNAKVDVLKGDVVPLDSPRQVVMLVAVKSDEIERAVVAESAHI
jgi:hypothetical protein